MPLSICAPNRRNSTAELAVKILLSALAVHFSRGCIFLTSNFARYFPFILGGECGGILARAVKGPTVAGPWLGKTDRYILCRRRVPPVCAAPILAETRRGGTNDKPTRFTSSCIPTGKKWDVSTTTSAWRWTACLLIFDLAGSYHPAPMILEPEAQSQDPVPPRRSAGSFGARLADRDCVPWSQVA